MELTYDVTSTLAAQIPRATVTGQRGTSSHRYLQQGFVEGEEEGELLAVLQMKDQGLGQTLL